MFPYDYAFSAPAEGVERARRRRGRMLGGVAALAAIVTVAVVVQRRQQIRGPHVAGPRPADPFGPSPSRPREEEATEPGQLDGLASGPIAAEAASPESGTPAADEEAVSRSLASVPGEHVVVSPELALVDPELAAWARARLPTRLTDEDLAPTPRVVPLRPSRVADPVPVLQVSAGEAGPGTELEESAASGLGARGRIARALAAVVAGSLFVGGLGGGVASPTRSGGPTAAQLSSATPPAAGRAAPLPSPPASGRVFVWAPDPTASFYDFEVFRGPRRIYGARTTHARLLLPAHWTYGDRRQSLLPGAYHWLVWPLRASGGDLRRGQTLVRARLEIGTT
jgi:hypothetical protein